MFGAKSKAKEATPPDRLNLGEARSTVNFSAAIAAMSHDPELASGETAVLPMIEIGVRHSKIQKREAEITKDNPCHYN